MRPVLRYFGRELLGFAGVMLAVCVVVALLAPHLSLFHTYLCMMPTLCIWLPAASQPMGGSLHRNLLLGCGTAMKNTKNGLASALVSGLRLEAVDMLGLAMIQAAIYLIVFAVVGIAVLTGSPEAADFGWPGLAALIMGVLLVFVEANSQFGTTFTLAVRLGRPRRTALAGSFVTCLVFGALTLLLTAALDAIWAIAFDFQGQSVLAMVPLWGYAAMVYLPIAVTVLEQAVAWVFGPKSMLFFLLIFLLVCQLPAQLVEDGPWAAYGPAVLAVLPLVLPAIGLLITAIGLRVLLRVDLKL